MAEIMLASPHPPEQCFRTLQTEWHAERSFQWQLPDRGAGLQRPNRIGVRFQCWHPAIGDSDPPVFAGQLVARSEGSTLEGRIRLPMKAAAQALEWLIGVLWIGVPMWVLALLVLIEGSAPLGDLLAFVLVPPVLVAFGFWRIGRHRRLDTSDEQRVRAAIGETLDAREVTSARGPHRRGVPAA